MGGLSNVTGALCIFSVLGPYTALAASGHGSILDPDRLFTIVTTVNLLSAPLNDLGQAMPVIFAAYASIKRIQSFLLLEDQTDTDSVGEDHGAVKRPLGDSCSAIKMENASFGWTAEGEPFLHDVTLNLQSGQLHVCVGSVASVSMIINLNCITHLNTCRVNRSSFYLYSAKRLRWEVNIYLPVIVVRIFRRIHLSCLVPFGRISLSACHSKRDVITKF